MTARWSGGAPAKVNLRLVVHERDGSGYHRIETVFQALALADRIELALEGGPGVDLDLRGVPPGELGALVDNLAMRAANWFLEVLKGRGLPVPGVRILLEKDIPHGTGLGGGSSDAATVLFGLNELTGRPIDTEDLMALGAELGADVPFFVSRSSRAIGSGKGDRITRLPALPERDVVLVIPRGPISTRWAYETLATDRSAAGAAPDPPAADDDSTAGRLIPYDWSQTASSARNDFEAVVFRHRPELRRIKAALSAVGARPALLSGSGSALFGVFELGTDLDRVEEDLRAALDAGMRILRTRTAI